MKNVKDQPYLTHIRNMESFFERYPDKWHTIAEDKDTQNTARFLLHLGFLQRNAIGQYRHQSEKAFQNSMSPDELEEYLQLEQSNAYFC